METSVFTIGEICSRFSSGKNITSEDIHEEGEYPVFGGNGLRGYTDRCNFQGQCSIIGRQGAYCGNVRYFSGEGYMSDHAVVAVTNKMHDNRYFAYKLGLMDLGRFSGQAAQPGISVTKVAKLKVEMPSLLIQRRIASILSAYDNLIENNNKRIRLLEQMAENLYKEWFVRFRFPGHKKVEMENGLPKGWKIAPLSSEYKTSSGGTPSRTNMNYYSGSIPWIKTGELQGTFILDTEEHITEEAIRNSSAKLIPAYSLLIAMYAGANVGNIGINSTQATCNQACCVITTKGRYPLNYLKFFLQTQKGFLQSISFGAAQQNISQDIIKKLKVILPPPELCMSFNKLISAYLNQCEVLMKETHLLARQRDLLLPRLMSGKLEVK